MPQSEIDTLNASSTEQSQRDWALRMAEVQREKAERDSYSYLIDAERLGERRARRASVLELLEARGIALTPEQHALIAACEDLKRLKAWFLKAATCQSADEIF